jgi:hypothetical protein
MNLLTLSRYGFTVVDANADADNNQPRRAVELRCMGR